MLIHLLGSEDSMTGAMTKKDETPGSRQHTHLTPSLWNSEGRSCPFCHHFCQDFRAPKLNVLMVDGEPLKCSVDGLGGLTCSLLPVRISQMLDPCFGGCEARTARGRGTGQRVMRPPHLAVMCGDAPSTQLRCSSAEPFVHYVVPMMRFDRLITSRG